MSICFHRNGTVHIAIDLFERRELLQAALHDAPIISLTRYVGPPHLSCMLVYAFIGICMHLYAF